MKKKHSIKGDEYKLDEGEWKFALLFWFMVIAAISWIIWVSIK